MMLIFPCQSCTSAMGSPLVVGVTPLVVGVPPLVVGVAPLFVGISPLVVGVAGHIYLSTIGQNTTQVS